MSTTYDVQGALVVGKRALKLLQEHEPRLRDRLSAGLADEVAHRLRVLEASKPGEVLARDGAKAATDWERQTAEQLASGVMTLRAGLRSKRKLSPAGLRDWGVGLTVKPEITKTVLAGANAIVGAATGLSAAELSALGVRQRDVRWLEVMAAKLAAHDAEQSDKKGSASALAAARKAAVLETFRLAHEIGSAGASEFSPMGSDPDAGEPERPELVAVFRKLAEDAVLPSQRKRSANAKAARKAGASPSPADASE